MSVCVYTASPAILFSFLRLSRHNNYLFPLWIAFQLERIVGTTPAKRMVAAEKGVFVFCH